MKARSILTSLICVAALGAATLPALAGDKPEPFPKAADEAPGQWPQVISQVQPFYPAKMLAEKIEGDVQVALVVTAKGETTQVRAFFSTRPEFEEPAVEAVKQWKFTPGMKDGRAVNTQMVVPIKFALPKEKAKS